MERIIRLNKTTIQSAFNGPWKILHLHTRLLAGGPGPVACRVYTQDKTRHRKWRQEYIMYHSHESHHLASCPIGCSDKRLNGNRLRRLMWRKTCEGEFRKVSKCSIKCYFFPSECRWWAAVGGNTYSPEPLLPDVLHTGKQRTHLHTHTHYWTVITTCHGTDTCLQVPSWHDKHTVLSTLRVLWRNRTCHGSDQDVIDKVEKNCVVILLCCNLL